MFLQPADAANVAPRDSTINQWSKAPAASHLGTIPAGASIVMGGAPVIASGSSVGQGGATGLQGLRDPITLAPISPQLLSSGFCTANLVTADQLQNANNAITDTAQNWSTVFLNLTGFNAPVSVQSIPGQMSASDFLDAVRSTTGVQGQLQGLTSNWSNAQTLNDALQAPPPIGGTLPQTNVQSAGTAAPQGTSGTVDGSLTDTLWTQPSTVTGQPSNTGGVVMPNHTLTNGPTTPTTGMGLLGPTSCSACQGIKAHAGAIALVIAGLLILSR